MMEALQMMPGLQKVRARFIEMLKDRQSGLARHIVAAWDSTERGAAVEELRNAAGILHKIAGTAGSLGFKELGLRARSCEEAILEEISHDTADLDLPETLLRQVSDFLDMASATINEAEQPHSV